MQDAPRYQDSEPSCVSPFCSFPPFPSDNPLSLSPTLYPPPPTSLRLGVWHLHSFLPVIVPLPLLPLPLFQQQGLLWPRQPHQHPHHSIGTPRPLPVSDPLKQANQVTQDLLEFCPIPSRGSHGTSTGTGSSAFSAAVPATALIQCLLRNLQHLQHCQQHLFFAVAAASGAELCHCVRCAFSAFAGPAALSSGCTC
jgi:hypothetical protein